MSKTIYLLEENKREKFYVIGLCDKVLYKAPKALITKRKKSSGLISK